MGRKQLHITVILFFSLFFVACKSTRIIRENTWEFLKQNNESVHYYDFDEKLNIHATEVQEEKKYFIFLRLYNPYSSFNIGSNILQKGIEMTETHNTSGSHISIGFDLSDNFYGLTLYAKPNLKLEQCTNTSSNEYMKSCNPNKSLQTTYALEVSKKEYETAYLWIKRKAESKTTHYSVSENFKIARKFLNSNSKIGKLNKPLSQEEESREFEQQNTFVCSTFICHVLYSSVNSIREYINDNLIDPDYTTPTDIISMPGIKQLFTSSWDNYNIAAQNFVKENELFNEWL